MQKCQMLLAILLVHCCVANVTVVAVARAGDKRKKEILYKEGILKGIGSSEDMQPYYGEVGVYGEGDSTRQELPAPVRA